MEKFGKNLPLTLFTFDLFNLLSAYLKILLIWWRFCVRVLSSHFNRREEDARSQERACEDKVREHAWNRSEFGPDLRYLRMQMHCWNEIGEWTSIYGDQSPEIEIRIRWAQEIDLSERERNCKPWRRKGEPRQRNGEPWRRNDEPRWRNGEPRRRNDESRRRSDEVYQRFLE